MIRVSGDFGKLATVRAGLRATPAAARLTAQALEPVFQGYLSGEFRAHADPYGKAWRATKLGNPPLVRTGAMAGSAKVTAEGTNIRFSVGARYSRFHQNKRPMLPLRGRVPKLYRLTALSKGGEVLFSVILGRAR